MSAVSQERRKVNDELKKLGLPGLEDRNLCASIAFFIRNHEQFRGMLMSVTQDKRHEAYKALAPKLRFTPRPLHVYEQEIKEKAEREQWPTLKPGEVYPQEFKPPSITTADRVEAALPQPEEDKSTRNLTLTCAHCLTEETFSSWSRMIAELKATQAGWFSEGDKSWCPLHKPTVQ